jgi:pSer/pThr/pTyr-binding forkhead associated (FHA) protein
MRVLTIGRASDNDVVTDKNDLTVSRYHCQIVQDGKQFRLSSIKAKNGTYVNGKEIAGETHLQPNDIIRIGNTTLPWMSYFGSGHLGNDETIAAQHPSVYNQPSHPAHPIHQPPQQVYVQHAPLIPEKINIEQKYLHGEAYQGSADFKRPAMQNIGHHVGNATGRVAGCLIWLVAIIVVGLIIFAIAG